MRSAERSQRTAVLLLWTERACVGVGVMLGAWCLAVWLEGRFVERLPLPPPVPARDTSSSAENTSAPAARAASAPIRGAWLATIEAPSVHLSATVLEGTDDGTLSAGAGHIEETPFPGDGGNVGIAGHRDTTFRAVRRLRVGDPLVLTTADRELRYRIRTMTIVSPEDVSVLNPTDHPTLTLVTCYPFTFIGHAPKRFIVSADLVSTERRTAPEATAR